MIRFTYRIEFLQNMSEDAVQQEDWQRIFHSYADVLPICEAKAGEIAGINFGHVIGEELFLFRTRFHPNINNRQRILFDNELYEIKRIVKIRNNQRSLNIVAFKMGEAR